MFYRQILEGVFVSKMKNRLFSGAEVKLFDVMKEAGVLENLADVIARTKDGHVNRMTEIDKSLLGKMLVGIANTFFY
jgi:hypothetical protein